MISRRDRGISIIYVHILSHFTQGTSASADFGILGGGGNSGTDFPQIPSEDCTLVEKERHSNGRNTLAAFHKKEWGTQHVPPSINWQRARSDTCANPQLWAEGQAVHGRQRRVRPNNLRTLALLWPPPKDSVLFRMLLNFRKKVFGEVAGGACFLLQRK